MLLKAMADESWPKITELDDRARRLLVGQLIKNPEKVNNYSSVLEKYRIPDLPLFEAVAGPSVPAQGSGPRSSQLPQEDPDFKPVPAPEKIRDLIAGLRRPNI
jgi:hypothetical protein